MDWEGSTGGILSCDRGGGCGPEGLDFLSYLTLRSYIPQWAWKNKPEGILPYENQPNKPTWNDFI